MSMAESDSEIYYRVQYKQQDNEHPFNYWLNFGRDDGYKTEREAVDLINDLGQRMATAFDCPLVFCLLAIRTQELEQYTLEP